MEYIYTLYYSTSHSYPLILVGNELSCQDIWGKLGDKRAIWSTAEQYSIEDAKQFSCSKCGQLLMGISTFMGSTHEMDEKTQSFFLSYNWSILHLQQYVVLVPFFREENKHMHGTN